MAGVRWSSWSSNTAAPDSGTWAGIPWTTTFDWSNTTASITCDGNGYYWTQSYDTQEWISSDGRRVSAQELAVNPTAIPETDEQRLAREQRAEEHRIQQEELRKEKEAAVKKAEEILKEHIGVKTFGEMHKAGYIEVDSQKHKGRKYRIPANSEEFIEVLDKDGSVVDTLCITTIECPMPERVLTRVILARLDEGRLLEVAISQGRRERSYYEAAT